MRPALKAFKDRRGEEMVNALEIGVAAGDHAQQIHDNLRCKSLVLVDSWHSQYRDVVFQWMETACRRFENDKRVTIIKSSSLGVYLFIKDYRFNFIYIDDNHSCEHVANELLAFSGLQWKGDMIAGHDYDPERPERVKKAVDEWAASEGLKVEHKDLDWWVWR